MVTNETLDIIARRRSSRNYKPEQISDEELRAVLEAGMRAPYAGEPSSHFTAVQNPDVLERLKSAAKLGARQSGVPHLQQLGENQSFDCLYGAPTLIIVSETEQSICPDVNCAAATQNILIAAESLGLGACWIYFVLQAFETHEGLALLEELKIPKGHKPYASVAIGYKAGEQAEIKTLPYSSRMDLIG